MPKKYDFWTFSKEIITVEEILKLFKQNRIRNCVDYEAAAEVFAIDYKYRRFNILPFIKPEMDMRVLFEIRKSGMLRFDNDYFGMVDGYYTDLYKFDSKSTGEDVRQLRLYYMRLNNRSYDDFDYQYYWHWRASTMKWQREFFEFDFEYLFEDCDPKHHISTEEENKLGFFKLRSWSDIPPWLKAVPKTREDEIKETMQRLNKMCFSVETAQEIKRKRGK